MELSLVTLPIELLSHLCTFLEPIEVVRLSFSSKHLSKLNSIDCLWKFFFLRKWNFPSLSIRRSKIHWREFFVQRENLVKVFSSRNWLSYNKNRNLILQPILEIVEENERNHRNLPVQEIISCCTSWLSQNTNLILRILSNLTFQNVAIISDVPLEFAYRHFLWLDNETSILAANALSHICLGTHNEKADIKIPLEMFSNPTEICAYLSGPYKGQYFYENKLTDDLMILDLNFSVDGSIKGEGQDECGSFFIEGNFNFDKRICVMNKKYRKQALSWVYNGIFDRHGIGGTWGDHSWGFVFKMWLDGDIQSREEKLKKYSHYQNPRQEAPFLQDETESAYYLSRVLELNKALNLLLVSNQTTEEYLLNVRNEFVDLGITFPENISAEDLKIKIKEILERVKDNSIFGLIGANENEVREEIKILADDSYSDFDRVVVSLMMKWRTLLGKDKFDRREILEFLSNTLKKIEEIP